MHEKKVIRSAAESLARLNEARANVASSADHSKVTRRLRQVTRPGSPSRALKKAGVALIIGTPDPITAVPGIALLASSHVAKRRDPTNLDDLAAETRRILRDIASLSL